MAHIRRMVQRPTTDIDMAYSGNDMGFALQQRGKPRRLAVSEYCSSLAEPKCRIEGTPYGGFQL